MIPLPTCVASSGTHQKMRRRSAPPASGPFAGRIFSATEVEHGKPAPDLFLHAADRMGVRPRGAPSSRTARSGSRPRTPPACGPSPMRAGSCRPSGCAQPTSCSRTCGSCRGYSASSRRSTYGRIPPWRRYSRSRGVSSRTRARNVGSRRPAPRPSPRAPRRSRRPSIENASRPVRPSDSRRLAVQELRAAGCPSSAGSSGGSARSSRRSPPARRAGSGPSPPSRATSPSRTPCRRSRSAARPRRGSARDASKIVVSSPSGRCTVHVPSRAGDEQVAQAHVGERAAHHHLVVAAPRAVRVEVACARRRARSGTGPPGCPGLIDAGRRDVVGRDRVADHDEAARALDVLDRRRGSRRHARRSTAAAARRSSRRPRRRARPRASSSARQRSSPVKTSAYVRAEHLAAGPTSAIVSCDLARRSARCRARKTSLAVAVLAERLGRRGRRPCGRRARRRRRAAARRGSSPSPRGGCAPRSCGCPRARRRRRGRPRRSPARSRSGSGPGVADAGRAAVADGVEAELRRGTA